VSVSRRDFLKTAGLATVGGSVVGFEPARAIASGAKEISNDWMGVLVDIPKCIGCRQCEAACRVANGFEPLPDEGRLDKSVFTEHRRPGPHHYTTINSFPNRPLFRLEEKLQHDLDRAADVFARREETRRRMEAEGASNREIGAALDALGPVISDDLEEGFSRNGIFLSVEESTVTTTRPGQRWALASEDQAYLVRREADALSVSELGPAFAKANCFHCNDPACVSACLVGAFSKQPDGAVTYDAWKCMGCRYCMVACPFQIPTYEYDNALTPQVRKCTLCANEGNPNKGGVPACVKTCPQECLTYGKRSELLVRAREKIRSEPEVYSEHIYGEHEAGGTSWLYLGPKDSSFEELGFLDLGASPPPMRTERIQHGIFKYFIPPLAGYALLGAVMWVTRPSADGKDQTPVEGKC
jgi:Fe-S-cluster-containing dehydrogenase component